MLDSQGRIALGEEVCSNANFHIGTEIKFEMVGKMKYKIISAGTNNCEIVVDKGNKIDSKYRIFVPASIRRNYTKHSIITCDEKGNLYLNFFELS